jgi:hypothetical protein
VLASADCAGAALGAAPAADGAARGVLALAATPAALAGDAEGPADAKGAALVARDGAGVVAAADADAGAAALVGAGAVCSALPEQAASSPPIAMSAALPRIWRRVRTAGMATLPGRTPEPDALM